jgi:thioredoxin
LSGGRSAQAAELLKKEGYQVTELKGGYLKWTTKLKPLEGVPAVSHDAAWDLAAFAKETKEGKAVVVDFYAKWCGPCKKMEPELEKLTKEGKIKVIRVDVDANKELAKSFSITEIPILLCYKKGEKIMTLIGYQTKEMLEAPFKQ